MSPKIETKKVIKSLFLSFFLIFTKLSFLKFYLFNIYYLYKSTNLNYVINMQLINLNLVLNTLDVNGIPLNHNLLDNLATIKILYESLLIYKHITMVYNIEMLSLYSLDVIKTIIEPLDLLIDSRPHNSELRNLINNLGEQVRFIVEHRFHSRMQWMSGGYPLESLIDNSPNPYIKLYYQQVIFDVHECLKSIKVVDSLITNKPLAIKRFVDCFGVWSEDTLVYFTNQNISVNTLEEKKNLFLDYMYYNTTDLKNTLIVYECQTYKPSKDLTEFLKSLT